MPRQTRNEIPVENKHAEFFSKFLDFLALIRSCDKRIRGMYCSLQSFYPENPFDSLWCTLILYVDNCYFPRRGGVSSVQP